MLIVRHSSGHHGFCELCGDTHLEAGLKPELITGNPYVDAGAWLWWVSPSALWVHTHAWGLSEPISGTTVVEVAPEGSTSNSDLCGCAHRVAGGITELNIPADSSWGRIHSGSFPRGSTPVPPTLHYSLESDLGASTPTAGEQILPPMGMWQPQSKEEALPNIQCRLWSPQYQHTPYQGDKGSTPWGKTWKASTPKTTLAPKILGAHSLHRVAPTWKQPFKTTVDNCFS